MLELSYSEMDSVGGGVSGETIGCAVGGAIAGSLGGGAWGGAAGCIVGAAIATGNYSKGSVGVGGPAGGFQLVQWVHNFLN